MATITCGWCKDRCHMTLDGDVNVTDSSSVEDADPFNADAAFICDGCGRMSVATWGTFFGPGHMEWEAYNGDDGPLHPEQMRWFPSVGHQVVFPDVPGEIADAASEAWTCHVVGAQRGAVVLARAVVESTAKDKGITKGSLDAKIEEMATQGLVRPAMAVQAHEIRHLGNSIAHGDLGDPVTAEDADEVLNLMGEVLNEVWQAPARAKRLADARAAKKAKP